MAIADKKFKNKSSIVISTFLGKLEYEQLCDFPEFSDSEKETLSLVLESVNKFLSSKEENFSKYDEQGSQPDDYISSLKELGLFGLIIPEEFGGIGLSNSAYSRVLSESSSFDASTSLTIGAHSSIGMKGILLFGTEEQKNKYLPDLATGQKIAAFCLTEPGAGSDAASIKTFAKKNENGDWVINGSKIWITNGAFASVFTVFARSDSENGKISAFIVDRDLNGVSTGPKENKLGIRASATTTVNFDNVVVPKENILGEEGKGFRIAMEILNNGRTGLGGGCVGGMKRMISLAVNQSNDRKQFNQKISQFELIKEKIALMTAKCFVTESIVRHVGNMIDSGHNDYSVEAAISKIYASESLWYTVNEALQIAGGNGFMKDYPYERYLRDSRINMIFEGTNEVLRLYVGLTGLKAVGEYLSGVSKATSGIFNDPIKGFGVLSNYLGSQISQRTMIGTPEIEGISLELREYASIYEKAVLSLQSSSEYLIKKHKKDIINQQIQVKRIAEIAIEIFSGLCAISRADYVFKNKSEEEKNAVLDIIKIVSNNSKRLINNHIRRIKMTNEDTSIGSLSKFIDEKGSYPWDVI